jgi:hypothetical protein
VADHLGADLVSDETVNDETVTTEPEPRGGRVARFAIAIIFGLFFAYVLLQGISTLVNLPPQLQLAEIPVPWVVLIALVVISPILFVAAWLVSRRRPVFAQVLIFAVALGTTYALWLSAYTLGLVILSAS